MTNINTSRIMACLIFSSIALSGCGGDGETDEQEVLSSPGTPQGNGFETGNTTNIPAGSDRAQGTPQEALADTPDASVTENETLGEDANTGSTANGESGTSDEEPGTDTDNEEESSWEGMEGMEGAILISDVDSEFEQANIASVSGFFGALPAAAPPVATFGDCEVTGNSQSSAVPETPSLNAGLIQFEGLLQATSLSWGGSGESNTYASNLPVNLQDILPPSGDILITGEGGVEFPAFSLSLASPEPIAIQAPPLGADATLDLSVPLTITWTPSSTATFMNVYMAGIDILSGDLAAGSQVFCTVDGDPGSITVPAEALSMLPIEAGLLGSYVLVGVSRGTTGSGDSPLTVNATALRSTGDIISIK